MSYDQITRDLCRKAAEDVRAVVERTGSLLADPADQMMIATYASSGCIGTAIGYLTALVERDTGERPDPEAALNALWEMIRPSALGAAGGSDKPFRDLLAKLGGRP